MLTLWIINRYKKWMPKYNKIKAIILVKQVVLESLINIITHYKIKRANTS